MGDTSSDMKPHSYMTHDEKLNRLMCCYRERSIAYLLSHITTRKTNFNSTHDCAFTCCYCSVTAGAACRIITLALTGSDRDTVTQILLVAFPRRVHEVLNDSQLSSGYRPWKYILGTYLPCWCKSILFLKKRILFTPAFGRYQRPGRRDFKFGVGTSPNCLPFGKWHVFTSLSKCQIMSINIR